MANYGRDPDRDAKEIIRSFIECNEDRAIDLEAQAAEARKSHQRAMRKAGEFRAAADALRKQLAVLDEGLAIRKGEAA